MFSFFFIYTDLSSTFHIPQFNKNDIWQNLHKHIYGVVFGRKKNDLDFVRKINGSRNKIKLKKIMFFISPPPPQKKKKKKNKKNKMRKSR